MQRVLNQLVERLDKVFGARLTSVVLYGSAAVGDHDGRFSDINVLCVLEQISPRELADCEPVFRWWRDLGNPSPLLLSEEELRTSTDCFPIEFHDIRERHRILKGADVVADLEVDDAFYRAQVEHELRAKLLRLRQKVGGVISDKQLLLQLMLDSVSTFCTLARHGLLLAGFAVGFEKRDIVRQAHERFGMDPAPFTLLLDVRQGKTKPREVDPLQLFDRYLQEIQTVVDAVDRLER
jgi:predicted nucleotidyltransferase